MSKRWWIIAVFGIGLSGIAVWLGDIYNDRQYRLVVLGPTPLYAASPLEQPRSNHVLGTLGPGQTVTVLRMRHGKDFRTFKIETATGIQGWVVEGQSARAIIPKNGAR